MAKWSLKLNAPFLLHDGLDIVLEDILADIMIVTDSLLHVIPLYSMKNKTVSYLIGTYRSILTMIKVMIHDNAYPSTNLYYH